MQISSFEFKARVESLDRFEKLLQTLHPRFAGIDEQTDTYFYVKEGRLKLREGNIENALIFYQREDVASSKLSRVKLYKHAPDSTLKEVLSSSLGVKVVVAKRRKIYFVDQTKIHLDVVKDLGTFLEVEVIDESGNLSPETLREKCNEFLRFFGLSNATLEKRSYSDLLLELQQITA